MAKISKKFPLKKVCYLMQMDHDEEIRKISAQTGKEWSELIRGFTGDGIKYYFAKRRRVMRFSQSMAEYQHATVVVKEVEVIKPMLIKPIENAIPGKGNGQLFCQCCGRTTTARKTYSYQINLEILKFCDECFFTGKYKPLVRQMI